MLFNQNLGNVVFFSIKLKKHDSKLYTNKRVGGSNKKNKVILKKIKLRIVNTRS